jgi:type IV pilus assembly protein PilF
MAIMDRRGKMKNRIGLGKLLMIPVLLFCLTACANTARLQERAGNHIQVGSAYLGSAQYTSALKEFLAAEKLTPDDPKVHYLLGISYYGKGLSDMAIAEFQRALTLKPDDTEAHNYLGAIYMEKGRWDDAIAAFNRSLANILSDTPSASLYNLGRAYYEKREYDRALKYYREAAEKEPDNALMTWIEKNIGMCLYAKGETEEALRHFQKSLTLAPSLVESHYWIGLCYQRLKRQADAVAAFQNAIRLAPESEFGKKAKESLKKLVP